MQQIDGVNLFANEHDVNHGIVETPGKGAGEPYLTESAEFFGYAVNDLVNAGVLEQQPMDVAEQRVLCVGAVDLLVAIHLGSEHSCAFQMLQLQSDTIGGFTKFGLQIAQPRGGAAVEEELE